MEDKKIIVELTEYEAKIVRYSLYNEGDRLEQMYGMKKIKNFITLWLINSC